MIVFVKLVAVYSENHCPRQPGSESAFFSCILGYSDKNNMKSIIYVTETNNRSKLQLIFDALCSKCLAYLVVKCFCISDSYISRIVQNPAHAQA